MSARPRGRRGAPSDEALFSALEELGWMPCHLVVADTFGLRLRGMMGMRTAIGKGLPVVMAFPSCASLHTCFMGYALDMAALDGTGKVIGTWRDVPPWSVRFAPGACAMVERASGARAR